jgi:hypothetical protein
VLRLGSRAVDRAYEGVVVMVDHAKIYSVKSNARRDARKAGLDADAVVQAEGGWRIAPPAPVPAAQTPEPVAASSPVEQSTSAETKRDRLKAMLGALGGASAIALQAAFGWQAHTLRGAISTLAKRDGVTIVREMRDGVTFYRIDGAGGAV